MSFEAVPLLIIILCVVFVLAGLYVLVRQQWLIQWLKGTGGLILIGLAVYWSLFALNLFGYQQVQVGKPIATVSFRSAGPQVFLATVAQPDGTNTDFELKGDLWQLDARIVRWKGIMSLFGVSPGYQLDRIQGRYLSLEDELTAERTVYSIAQNAVGLDVWQRARDGWSMVVDARYGSATYLPMADGAIFEVSLESSGLVGRPLNGSAQQAVTQWE